QIAIQGKRAEIRLVDIQVIPANELIQQQLGVPLQSPVQQIERVRFANEEPTQYEIAYIPWQVAPGMTKEHAETSLYGSLEEEYDVHVGYTSEHVEIILADEIICQHLKCEQGA